MTVKRTDYAIKWVLEAVLISVLTAGVIVGFGAELNGLGELLFGLIVYLIGLALIGLRLFAHVDTLLMERISEAA